MSLSRVYRVVTRYESDTSRAESGMMRMANRAAKMDSRLSRLQQKMSSIGRFLQGAAMGGAAVGFGVIRG